MSEKEIRAIISAVCTDLDRRVRNAVSQSLRKVVLPTALGAGLALAGGCDNGRTVDTGDADVGVTQDSVNPHPDQALDVPAIPPYMAPDPDARPDAPVVPPYMAPDPDAFADSFEPPPEPDYMAPNPDLGPIPLYNAPPP